MPADRQERQPRFSPSLHSLLSNDFRFRLLVVGKPGSGKSSLIKTIYNVDMPRAPTNVSGITAEFRPRDNRHLIVHECSASGLGEVQAIRDFITTRNHTSRQASERLHAIWICIPMSDVINGQSDEGLKLLLGTGVPLVIVFTKFDLSSSHNDYEERCRSLFGNVPVDIVSTQPKFRRLINKLVATTDKVIIAHSRNISAPAEAQGTRMSTVTLAWSVSQRASRSINIQAAIEVGRSRYWRRLGASQDFAGQTLADCVEVIHSDIVGVWNLPDKDRCLSSTAFKVRISHLIQDLSRPPIGASSRPRPSDTQGTGAAWLNERYENRNEYICLVVAYIVDLTLILCDVFDGRGNVSPSGVQSIMNDFASSSPKTSIHAEICRFIKTVHQFEYQDNDVVLTKIIDLIRQHCDSSSARK
ncbi:hypothetical protein F5888DRAFT_1211977 [Russula emetica]|nr:hypothetical protein F5888DRAFT_1211977 [Russula emetica]